MLISRNGQKTSVHKKKKQNKKTSKAIPRRVECYRLKHRMCKMKQKRLKIIPPPTTCLPPAAPALCPGNLDRKWTCTVHLSHETKEILSAIMINVKKFTSRLFKKLRWFVILKKSYWLSSLMLSLIFNLFVPRFSLLCPCLRLASSNVAYRIDGPVAPSS